MRTTHMAKLATGLAVVITAGLMAYVGLSPAEAQEAERPPACTELPEPPQPPPPAGEPAPTTIETLAQAYWCVLDNYYSGSVLDHRALLLAGYQTFTQELQRRGLDLAMATTPAFTGDRAADWDAFSAKYTEVLAALPQDATLHEELALTTLEAMVDSLRDDHAAVRVAQASGPGADRAWGLGIHTQPVGGARAEASLDMVPPLYLDFIFPESPADKAGLRPGDIIVAVNDLPVYVNGQLNPGAVAWLYPSYLDADKVRVTVQRPDTKKTRRLTLTPGEFPWGAVPTVPAEVVDGGIAHVTLPTFFDGAAGQVRQAIDNLRAGTTLRGVILDLRGNRGGSPTEVSKLLGAFVHDKVWSSFCDVRGDCEPQRTDDSQPLLNLPLVVLTDRDCASACDAFSGAVKDLNVGALVGARTAGIVSGPAGAYRLADNKTELFFPKRHSIGANGEVIAGIGVPPDYFAPLTPLDLATGRDPGLAKAIELLTA